MKELEPNSINVFAEMERIEREITEAIARATLLPNLSFDPLNSNMSRYASEIHQQMFFRRPGITPPEKKA